MLITIEQLYSLPTGEKLTRYFIDNLLTGFGIIGGAIAPGEYKLTISRSDHRSDLFYYNEGMNKITGKKDFYVMGYEERRGWRKHNLIVALPVITTSESGIIQKEAKGLISFCLFCQEDENCLNNCVTGDLIGIEGGMETMIRSRLHYLKTYPLIYPAANAGTGKLIIKSAD